MSQAGQTPQTHDQAAAQRAAQEAAMQQAAAQHAAMQQAAQQAAQAQQGQYTPEQQQAMAQQQAQQQAYAQQQQQAYAQQQQAYAQQQAQQQAQFQQQQAQQFAAQQQAVAQQQAKAQGTAVPAAAAPAQRTAEAAAQATPQTKPAGEAKPAAETQAAPKTRKSAGGGGARGGDTDLASSGLPLHDVLSDMLDAGASDLHLTTNTNPMMRIRGALQKMEQYPVLDKTVLQKVLFQLMTQKQREMFEKKLELDFAYSLPGRARFRVNIYRQRESLGAAMRVIPFEILPLEKLGIPESVSALAYLPRGMVLVTGPTGSGKSTTLAALIDLANRTRDDHIMTVEDPIEFLHQHKRCIVNQREVGEDTMSFANALKSALRQDPDIILVGEMRDLETISVALTAAETGHLVYGTLHTQDAAQTIDRIIDAFPPEQQQQVRVMLAGALQGVVCQALCKTADGKGRVAATEVMIGIPAIRNLIREGKTHQIYSALQAGSKHGMYTMDQHLAELVKAGRITYDTGLEKCHHPEDFKRLCGKV